MADELSLSAEFPPADEAAWRVLAIKALDGASLETLNTRTQHGVSVRPLYTEADWPSSRDASGLPGSATFARGAVTNRDPYLPWDIRQAVSAPRPEDASREALEALGGGASSLELLLDRTGRDGIQIWTADDFRTLLDGVQLDLAPIALAPTGERLEDAMAYAALLASSGVKAEARIDFNCDPVGRLARAGRLENEPAKAIGSAARAACDIASAFPRSSALRVDARVVHEAGGTEVQEIAYLAATGAEYMRALISAGLSARAAGRSLLFTLSVGPDVQVEIAKLRAARRVWALIADAFGASPADMRLQACSSVRMLTRRDPSVNVLRTTAACFAAGVGGADIVTLSAFTDALGRPGPAARRLARNTQIIAQEESGLGRVIDPAGGAWTFERLSEDLASASWTLFQEIELEGGIVQALLGGRLHSAVQQAKTDRSYALARRKEWVTGVNDFPDLAETPPTLADPPLRLDNLEKKTRAVGATFSDLCSEASDGASLLDLTPGEPPTTFCTPLAPVRLSEPFERLRDRADAETRAGHPPEALLAVLGPLAEHSARATYSANFFAVAGVATQAPSWDDLISRIRRQAESGPGPVVCLCGSDKRYALEAETAAAAIRAAGAARIVLAGRPQDNEPSLRAAGVTDFIYVGVDVPASLSNILGWTQSGTED
jgi:methylmalonyl-CoA mutase